MTDDTEHEYDYPMGSGAGLGQCTSEQVRAAMRGPSQVPSREQELEAQCAAMREALELDGQLEGFDCPHDAEHRCRCGEIEKDLWARYHAARDRALAIDAGKALLERLGKAERERDEAAAACQQKHGVHHSWVNAATQSRAQALEDAAKVAEGMVVMACVDCRERIAVAIRALKDGGGT